MLNIALAGAVTFVSALALAIFVYASQPTTSIKRIWSLLCLLTSLVGYCIMIGWSVGDPVRAWTWCYLLNLYAIFIPVVFFHFAVAFTNRTHQKKIELMVYYGISALYFLTALAMPNAFIADVTYRKVVSYYTLGGPLYKFYPVLYGFLSCYGLILLLKSYGTSNEAKKNQLMYIFTGLAISFLGGWTTLPLIFNIELYPYAIWLIPIYTYIITYAIAKHRLMDIRLLIKRGFTYTIHVSAISLLYVTCILLTEHWFKHIFGYSDFSHSLIAAIIIAFLFSPLKHVIQNIVERFLFKGSFLEMAEQNARLRREVFHMKRYRSLTSLTKKFVKEIRICISILIKYNLLMRKKLDDPKFLKKIGKEYNEQINHMYGLVDQLNMVTEHKVPSLKKVCIKSLIEKVLCKIRPEMNYRKVEVFKYYDEGKPMNIDVDPIQIRQAIHNILYNAMQAMPDGGQIWIGLEQSADKVHLSIKDTAQGIPKDKLKQIFNPSYASRYNPSGMGLSVTRSIINNHNGNIRAESEVGGGTEIIIELPVLV